ncbi:hypothetical protein Nepgr_015210 [Nepenthes gracilis]|uniref:NHL repeat-containing protein n=1 Tax=Nepenthes gracilis TaxID=150966 RepID=A0AAD3SMH0_NEPGR|nr:hypothetical protein Nepgr_015210 [Nepenthes gracilis]
MAARWVVLLLILVVFLKWQAFASASSDPARIAGGIAFNVASSLFKWLWSLKSPAKTGVSGRSMVKFEGGYTVETLFDGSKLGIEPYSVLPSPSGELLILDSANSNLYRVSTPLSPYSRPKLVAGSPEGYSGHVDGKLREARMYNPKGFTLDDKGNIYIADTINMAIRKISDAGITTIAGGKLNGRGSHVDGPSEDAKFSDDFDVVYVGSSCTLLIVDRGNQAIREIQLHYDDCSSEIHYDGNARLGVAVLVAVGFFGYMLALLQQRVQALFSSQGKKNSAIATRYQRAHHSVIPPLIHDEDEPEKPEEGFCGSFWRLILKAGSLAAKILGALIFWGSRKDQLHQTNLTQLQQQMYPGRHEDSWPVQDNCIIQDEDEPPSAETGSPTSISAKTYPFMNNDVDNTQQFRQRQMHQQWQQQQRRQLHQQWQQQQQKQQPVQQKQPQQQQRHYSSVLKANHVEQSSEANEIVFGAVQEQDGRREAVVIKAVDYTDPTYNQHNIRSRFNYMGYSSYGYS